MAPREDHPSIETRIRAGVSVFAGNDPRRAVQAQVIRPVDRQVLVASGVLAMVVECRGAPGVGLAARLFIEAVARRFDRSRRDDGWLVRAVEVGCDAVRTAAGRQRFLRDATVSGAVLLLHHGMAQAAFIGGTPLFLARGAVWYRLSGDGATHPLSQSAPVTWLQPLTLEASDHFLLCNRALMQSQRSILVPGAAPTPSFPPPLFLPHQPRHPQFLCDALMTEACPDESHTPLATAILSVENANAHQSLSRCAR